MHENQTISKQKCELTKLHVQQIQNISKLSEKLIFGLNYLPKCMPEYVV